MQSSTNNEIQDAIKFINNNYPGMYEYFGAEAIKKVLKFIIKCGGKINIRKKSEENFIGDLGKEYIKCIFSDIVTGEEICVESKPDGIKLDFEFVVNDKIMTVEVKTISDLFNPIMAIMHDIQKEQKDDKELCDKIKYIEKNCFIIMTPSDIHRKRDKDEFKNEFIKILKEDFKIGNKKQSFLIKCFQAYQIQIETKEEKLEWVLSMGAGRGSDKTRALQKLKEGRILKQMPWTDILIVVILDKDLSFDKVLEFIYGRNNFYLQTFEEFLRIQKSGEITELTKIKQYEGQGNIWERPSFQRLKCIIFIYPYMKTSLICPSMNNFNNFSNPEYILLMRKFEEIDIKSFFTGQKHI